MLTIHDEIAGDPIEFKYVESRYDLKKVRTFIKVSRIVAVDTESTGLNCYKPGWQLRSVQVGNAHRCYIIPARFRLFIGSMMQNADCTWLAHNGPHDIRSIDAHIGFETGVQCAAETFLPGHYIDARNQQEGGIGHGLKDLAVAYVDRTAGRWEIALKAEFKKIELPVPGQVYKSGPRKGQPKMRKAKLSEGWALIDPTHPAYIAYSGADPILTYRVWQKLRRVAREQAHLYRMDRRVQAATDRLQRRAIRLDVRYTTRLGQAYATRAAELIAIAESLGCANIQSGKQIAECLQRLGVKLTEKTKTGQLKTDNDILRALLKWAQTNKEDGPRYEEISEFIHAVLGAKQLLKRKASYTDQMLSEMDADGRVHPSINSLGARTTRMSVSNPPLQQLPTKDRESDE